MPKIYEAYQKKEEERKRRGGARDARAPSLDWGPPAQPEGARKASWASRLRKKVRRAQRQEAASYADYNRCRVSLIQPDSYAAEQFRTLRVRIDSLSAQRPITSVAVLSPNDGDGKTTAAINLAAVSAMVAGQRVALLDCDLRHPRVASVLGLEPQGGIAEVLAGTASIDEVIIKVEEPGFDVIAVRSLPVNPSELLTSEGMGRLMEELFERYDRVVIDTPAALGISDSKSIAEVCDGLLVVVRAGQTPADDVKATLDLVDRRRVIGLILNQEMSAPRSLWGGRRLG